MRPPMLSLEKVGQFERNPHLKATTGTRLNAKRIDECIGVVEETACKDSQTISQWNVSRWLRVRPNPRESFGGTSRGKVYAISISTIAVVLHLLHQIIRIYM